MVQTARWVDGPAAIRSTPIPPWKWELHKKEICWKYEEMILKDLVEWMKVHRDFSATYVF
jgi:hypothetical protein